MVFEQAATLLNARAAGSSEAAYWMARQLVDEALGAKALFVGEDTKYSYQESFSLAST